LTEAAAKGLNPDTLVLGCTHYPLIRTLIEEAVPSGMRVIDSAESTADAALRLIGRAAQEHSPDAPVIRCFATDSVDKFQRLGTRFLERPVGDVELVDLGG